MLSPIARRRGAAAIGVLITACSAARHEPPPIVTQEHPVILVVVNQTSVELGVYLAESRGHARIGSVAASSEKALVIRETLVRGRTQFRIYAFRGAEACPVARLIDTSFSRNPRMIVTQKDTVTSGYLPGDACAIPI